MKTTIKLGMLAAAFLLTFASCSNMVKDPVAVDNAAAKSVVTGHTTEAKGFKVTEIKGYVYGDTANSSNAQYQVQVKFSYRPDEKTLHGVTFRTLNKQTGTDAAYAVPTVKETLTPDKTEVVDGTVYFTFNRKSTDIVNLLVFVKADKVMAENGAKLDHDGDTAFGEADDDSYAEIINKNGDTLGIENYFHELGVNSAGQNKTWMINSVTFATNASSTGADKNMLKQVILTPATIDGVKDTDLKAFNSGLTTEINNRVTLEEYDWQNAKWVELSKPTFSYSSITNNWTAAVSISAGRYARILFKGRDTAKAYTDKKLRDYSIKYTLDNEVSPIYQLGAHSTDYSKSSDVATWFWKGTDMVVTKETGLVRIKFNRSTTTTFETYGTAWNTVSIQNVLAGKKTLFKGFDRDTVTKENFKCYKGKDLLTIKDIKLVKSDVENLPEALNEIVILFDDSAITEPDVYISFKVKTSAFTGKNETTNKAFEFPALSFADNMPPAEMGTADVDALKGWRKY